MIARTQVVVEAGGRLGRLHAEPPLTVRRVHAERPDTCALCLVGTAAGPLAGDDLALELRLEPDARATLTAAGAAIAQGSARLDGTSPGGRHDGATSRLAMNVSLGDHAVLDADPGALIVCAGARVDVGVSIAMAATASVRWRELIVLGRTGRAVRCGHDPLGRRARRTACAAPVRRPHRPTPRWPGPVCSPAGAWWPPRSSPGPRWTRP